MAFSYRNRTGQTYSRHGRKVQRRNRREQQSSSFAKDAAGSLDAVPDGDEAAEVSTSGPPVLRKAAARTAG